MPKGARTDCRRPDSSATIPDVPGSAAQYAEILRSGRWFQGLPAALQTQLLGVATVRSLGEGEHLFQRGDPFCGLYAIVDGSVRITGASEAGKEALLTLIEPPSWFGEIAVFDREARTHDAIGEVPSTLVRVAPGPLDALLQAEPLFWHHLGALMASKVRLLFTLLEDLALFPIDVRLARRLLLMSGAYGEWRDRSRRVVEVSQEQLAAMLGSSRQTINTVLKQFASQGILRVAYGQIELLDGPALMRRAELAEGTGGAQR
ncbi:MAG: Crp/Fnr family transcriptional regulator [Deltaproteobacteria bacterium]|jgi:CRP/FNR family cyclic AMP-dependent transcriptional regulator|nr:Crp/Fnr family transcriptional regulator [Deltaproteobacteria bacterium]